MFVCLGIYPGIYYETCPKKIPLGKIWKKSHGLLEFALGLPRLTEIPGDHETLCIVHHVGLYVDFSSMKSSLGL